MVGLWYRRKLRGTREASNDGRVRVRIIHGLNISHKELTYLLQKSTSHQKPWHYAHAPRGIDRQEKTIARPLPRLIRKTINKYLMLQLRYITVHHTCMLGESQSSTQVFLRSTTTHQHDSNITIFISQKLLQGIKHIIFSDLQVLCRIL